MLEGIGLTSDEEAVYCALLTQPGQSAKDLTAAGSGLSRSRAGCVVDGLVERGLVTCLPGQPVRYAAVAPDVGVERLVHGRIAEARLAQQRVPALMDLFWAGQRNTNSVDFIEIVRSKTAIVQRWQQLQQSLSAELRAFDCPPYLADPNETDPTEVARLADGVGYRVIYTQDVLDAPGRWADLELSIVAGEQARVLQQLPTKLTLFDDVAALLFLEASESRPPSVVVVHRSPLLDALSALFETYWRMAIPLTIKSAGIVGLDAAPPPRAEEERLIRLLAAGMGDDAIQRVLGVSASTVHRRVHDLMRSLGAKSRFQAGLQLGRMGRDTR